MSGCVYVKPDEPVPFYASKELMAACEVADVGTTVYAIHWLGAVELNPLGLVAIFAIKGYALYRRYHYDKEIGQEGAGLILNTIACAPVINNVTVIKELR